MAPVIRFHFLPLKIRFINHSHIPKKISRKKLKWDRFKQLYNQDKGLIHVITLARGHSIFWGIKSCYLEVFVPCFQVWPTCRRYLPHNYCMLGPWSIIVRLVDEVLASISKNSISSTLDLEAFHFSKRAKELFFIFLFLQKSGRNIFTIHIISTKVFGQ